MPEAATNNLVRGTLDVMVLRALAREELHGFAIARWIRDTGGEAVTFEDAALYQALHRLQRKGLVESSWGRSENNRRARFYHLTAKGRKKLSQEAEAFRSFASAVTRLLDMPS